METVASAPLALADRLVYAMEGDARPQDFILLLHLHHTPDLDALQAGAQSARNRFPVSGSILHRLCWCPVSAQADGVQAAAGEDALHAFVDAQLDLRRSVPVQQLLLAETEERPAILATRVHHAAADGASAARWLSHQWAVATGRAAPVEQIHRFEQPCLRAHPQPVRHSRFAFATPPHRLWHRSSAPARARRWQTIALPAATLRPACERAHVAYHDLLIVILLDVFQRWNERHGAGQQNQLGLWLPVNIRQRGTEAFGNGTSRIRVYTCYSPSLSRLEKCRRVRQQISWSMRHGEWAVPQAHPLLRLPAWLQLPLLRTILRRPTLDMGSTVFSHVEGEKSFPPAFKAGVARVDVVGQLHEHYPLAFNAVSHGADGAETTWLTVTSDPALCTATDLAEIVDLIRDEVEAAQAALLCARSRR